MLVVSIGLFKAGKEGISWKGALRALESWQCCLFSVGQIGNSAWEQQASLARSPKPWALVPTGHDGASGALTVGAAWLFLWVQPQPLSGTGSLNQRVSKSL